MDSGCAERLTSWIVIAVLAGVVAVVASILRSKRAQKQLDQMGYRKVDDLRTLPIGVPSFLGHMAQHWAAIIDENMPMYVFNVGTGYTVCVWRSALSIQAKLAIHGALGPGNTYRGALNNVNLAAVEPSLVNRMQVFSDGPNSANQLLKGTQIPAAYLSVSGQAQNWIFQYENGICAFYQNVDTQLPSWVLLLEGARHIESSLRKATTG